MVDEGVFSISAPNCPNGNQMCAIFPSGRMPLWRCRHRNCCGAKSISMQNSSFFGGKKVPLHKIMMVIYFFLASGFNGTNKQIIESTKLAPNTITSIIDDIYLLIEGDLKLEDMTIGKFILYFLTK